MDRNSETDVSDNKPLDKEDKKLPINLATSIERVGFLCGGWVMWQAISLQFTVKAMIKLLPNAIIHSNLEGHISVYSDFPYQDL